MRLDPGVFDKSRAGFLRLVEVKLAGRDDVEVEGLQQLAEFGELAGVVRGDHQPVTGMETQGFAHGASAARCNSLSRPMPAAASIINWSSSSRVNGVCSAVPWISTKRPAPVMTKLASVSASESSR